MTIGGAVYFLLGLALLIAGAEALVRGASRLAAAAGVSPLVIGLTVVAYATSAPEFAVSLQSAYTGQGAVALGNVVGSNIFNVLAILGVSALIAPLLLDRQLVRWDIWVMVGTAALGAFLCSDANVSFSDGLLLLAAAVCYTGWCVWRGRRGTADVGLVQSGALVPSHDSPPRSVRWILLTVAGLALLVQGSRWLVDSSIDLARGLGLSELIIGLTIVAAGTSLPELSTSIVAALRGQRDIAVGNVVGSNIFNILAVLGSAAAVSPGGLAVPEPALHFDIPVMLVASIACVPIFFTGYRIDRWEGALFLGYYVAYTVYLVLESARYSGLDSFRTVITWYVGPLTFVILLASVLQGLRRRRGS